MAARLTVVSVVSLTFALGCGGRTVLDQDEPLLSSQGESDSGLSDASARPHDAGPTGAITCGAKTCPAETEVCCAGITGESCTAKGKCSNGAALTCSGRANCSEGQVCCADLGSLVSLLSGAAGTAGGLAALLGGGGAGLAGLAGGDAGLNLNVSCADTCTASGDVVLCEGDTDCTGTNTCQASPFGVKACLPATGTTGGTAGTLGGFFGGLGGTSGTTKK